MTCLPNCSTCPARGTPPYPQSCGHVCLTCAIKELCSGEAKPVFPALYSTNKGIRCCTFLWPAHPYLAEPAAGAYSRIDWQATPSTPTYLPAAPTKGIPLGGAPSEAPRLAAVNYPKGPERHLYHYETQTEAHRANLTTLRATSGKLRLFARRGTVPATYSCHRSSRRRLERCFTRTDLQTVWVFCGIHSSSPNLPLHPYNA